MAMLVITRGYIYGYGYIYVVIPIFLWLFIYLMVIYVYRWYIYIYYPPQINGYPHIETIDFADQLSASKKRRTKKPRRLSINASTNGGGPRIRPKIFSTNLELAISW